jgi:hypothetical protein
MGYQIERQTTFMGRDAISKVSITLRDKGQPLPFSSAQRAEIEAQIGKKLPENSVIDDSCTLGAMLKRGETVFRFFNTQTAKEESILLADIVAAHPNVDYDQVVIDFSTSQMIVPGQAPLFTSDMIDFMRASGASEEFIQERLAIEEDARRRNNG